MLIEDKGQNTGETGYIHRQSLPSLTPYLIKNNIVKYLCSIKTDRKKNCLKRNLDCMSQKKNLFWSAKLNISEFQSASAEKKYTSAKCTLLSS